MTVDALLRQHLDKLFVYALSLTRNEDAARDLVQDCALKALAARRVPREEAAFRPWLFRILRNRFLDLKRRREPAALSLCDAAEVAETGMAGEQAENWRGDERLIDAITVRIALAKLSDPHREILTLVDLAGFSYAESAQMLEVPLGTVMSRVARARQALLREVETQNVVPVAAARRNVLGRT